jgi:hypothetical protein
VLRIKARGHRDLVTAVGHAAPGARSRSPTIARPATSPTAWASSSMSIILSRTCSGSSSITSRPIPPARSNESFPAPEARRLLRRLEFHYVPKHASWLNMVGCEHRSAPLSGSRPTAILKAGSDFSASQSSRSRAAAQSPRAAIFRCPRSSGRRRKRHAPACPSPLANPEESPYLRPGRARTPLALADPVEQPNIYGTNGLCRARRPHQPVR